MVRIFTLVTLIFFLNRSFAQSAHDPQISLEEDKINPFFHLLTPPILSSEEAQQKLWDIGQILKQHRDRAYYFSNIYWFVTRKMREEKPIVSKKYGQQSAVCLEALVVSFAEEYRKALMAQYLPGQKEGTPLPSPWANHFSYTRSDDSTPNQILVLGLNAHISYDLPRSIDSVAKNIPMCSLSSMAPMYFDLNKLFVKMINDLNDLLEQSVETIEGDNKDLFSPLRKQALLTIVFQLRAEAWRNAVILNQIQRPSTYQEKVKQLEKQALKTSNVLMHSSILFPYSGF